MLLNDKGKNTFQSNAHSYDLYRPSYPKELIAHLQNKTLLNHNSSILEIGCGTGQLTKQLTKYNPSIHAIDISEDMIDIAKNNFKDNPNITLEQTSYEEYAAPLNNFDFIVAATSFHWISREIRLTKTHQLLKENGMFALIQNTATPDSQSAIRQSIKQLNQAIIPEDILNSKASLNNATQELIEEIQSSPLFNSVEITKYNYAHSLNADDYISYLETLSFYHNLPQEIKEKLFPEIHKTIMKNGGIFQQTFTATMAVAYKV